MASVLPWNSTVTLPLGDYDRLFTEAHLSSVDSAHAERLRHLQLEFEQKTNTLDVAHKKRLSALDDEVAAREAAKRERRKSESELRDLFPNNFQLLDHTAIGTFNISGVPGSDADVASFEVEMIVRVLFADWTTVSIANSSAIVASDWRVDWQPLLTHSVSERVGQSTTWTPIDLMSDDRTMLLLRKGTHSFLTNRAGRYRLRFTAHTRVRKSRQLQSVSLTLGFPLSRAGLTLVGAQRVDELSVQPPHAVTTVLPSNSTASPSTTISMTMPPTNRFEFTWFDPHGQPSRRRQSQLKTPEQANNTETAPEQSAPQLTVQHDALTSINEGLVQTTHHVVYKSTGDSSPVGSVQIIIRDNVTRVTSVVAAGLQGWQVDSFPNHTRLVVAFKSSHLESTTNLLIYTEKEHNSGELRFPVLECQHVLRQTGRLGLATVANVQVDPTHTLGLSTIDPTEITSSLRLNTDRPIVLAFKYLTTRYDLRVGVTRHTQLEVLEAAVDRAHYTAAVVDTNIMHSLHLSLRHTRQQYLSLRGLPPTARMFSVSVDSVSTRPIQGDTPGSLLIPLLGRLQGENDGVSHSLRLVISYVSTQDVMDSHGNFSLALPRLSVPVSVLTADVQLPERWDYNLTSEMGQDVDELDFEIPGIVGWGRKSERVRTKDAVARHRGSSAAHHRRRPTWDTDPTDVGDGDGVTMGIPSSGKTYLFQRLLVVDSAIHVNVTYGPEATDPPEPASFWRRLWS